MDVSMLWASHWVRATTRHVFVYTLVCSSFRELVLSLPFFPMNLWPSFPIPSCLLTLLIMTWDWDGGVEGGGGVGSRLGEINFLNAAIATCQHSVEQLLCYRSGSHT